MSVILRSIQATTMRAIALGALLAVTGACDAFAGFDRGPPCPAGFACSLSEQHDGACPHAAIVLDEKDKNTRYESDPYSSSFEKACIAKAGALAARRGGDLRLSLANGTVKTFKDKLRTKACKAGPYDSCMNYMLYDYFPQHQLYLVHIIYYESDQWLLVRQQDGREEEIVAPPGYSPGKTWLASVYWTEGPSDGNNGIDIVPASSDSTEPAFHYRSEGYELWQYVGWDGDNRLLVKVDWHPTPESALVTWPAEIVRENGKWQLHKLPPK